MTFKPAWFLTADTAQKLQNKQAQGPQLTEVWHFLLKTKGYTSYISTLGGSTTPCMILSVQVMLLFEDTVECLKCRVGCMATIPVILLAVRL